MASLKRDRLETKLLVSILLLTFLTGCHPRTYVLDPNLCYTPTTCDIAERSSPFPPLEKEELKEEWGKELLIGEKFGEELDLYRSITALKRALFLIPEDESERRTQIEYDILTAYFFAEKYSDVIRSFDESNLKNLSKDSPLFNDLLVMLVLSYEKICDPYKAKVVLDILRESAPERAEKLQLSKAIQEGDLPTLQAMNRPSWVDCYCQERLSVRKAQIYNALFPGAGYYYVGQKKTALTSFVLNALFLTATAQFFKQGYISAGIITASLEFGWYVGGINGAGLAAKFHNDHTYSQYARESMIEDQLFPTLMIQHAF